jgi:predicted metalloenzyme YecM
MKKVTKETTRDQLIEMISTYQDELENSKKEKSELVKRLDDFEKTIEKLSAELEVKNTPKQPKLSIEANFRKKYPKEKFMTHDAIKHGEIVNGQNVVTNFKVGEPFPENHKLLKKFLESGQVVQVEG